MSNAVVGQNVSKSKQKIKRRSIEGQTEEVTILSGSTFTAPFRTIAALVNSVVKPRRPNRCRPVNHDLGGFSTEAEKAGWDAVSDEAWKSLDD